MRNLNLELCAARKLQISNDMWPQISYMPLDFNARLGLQNAFQSAYSLLCGYSNVDVKSCIFSTSASYRCFKSLILSIYIQIWRLPLWDLLVLHSTSLLPLGLCRRGAGCVRMQTQIEKVCVWTFQRQTYCYKPIGSHIWPICCVKFPRKSADGIRVARLHGSADAAKPELGPLEVDLEETSPPKLPRQGDGWDRGKRKINTVKTGSVWIPVDTHRGMAWVFSIYKQRWGWI